MPSSAGAPPPNQLPATQHAPPTSDPGGTPRPSGAGAQVVHDGYSTWLWLEGRVQTFPRRAQAQLGRRVGDACLDALSATTVASYARAPQRRVRLLERANEQLALLRILLRGARDLHWLSIDQHEHALRLVDAWGRQLGAWRRHDLQRLGPSGRGAPR